MRISRKKSLIAQLLATRSIPVIATAAGIVAGVVLVRMLRRVTRHASTETANSTAPAMTPATGNVHAADAPIGKPGRNEEDRLDEALQESFPTSDPVSIQIA